MVTRELKLSLALNLVLFILLLVAVLENRPPYAYVDKVNDREYRACFIQHRWGYQKECTAPSNFSQADYFAYSFNRNYRGWKTTITTGNK